MSQNNLFLIKGREEKDFKDRKKTFESTNRLLNCNQFNTSSQIIQIRSKLNITFF
jgi:hypothetical protein